MRAVCAVFLLMVMASDALRDMHSASTELSHSAKEVEQTKEEGICRAKNDDFNYRGTCSHVIDEYGCKVTSICEWVPDFWRHESVAKKCSPALLVTDFAKCKILETFWKHLLDYLKLFKAVQFIWKILTDSQKMSSHGGSVEGLRI